MKVSVSLLVFFITFSGLAQTSYSGNVLDAYDKKYLEGVTVYIPNKGSVTTNSRGYFSLLGESGDTLMLNFPGFIDHQLILGPERFLLLQIQDKARMLPTFQVEAEPYKFRFKNGKLYLAEDEPDLERRLSTGITAGASPSAELVPNFAVYGVLSSLTKRNRELRKYEERLEWIKRRQGYLEVIDSDSIRTEMMSSYKLEREDWDQIIIRFNEFHLEHEFLDWSKDRVIASLKEFIRIESYLGN